MKNTVYNYSIDGRYSDLMTMLSDLPSKYYLQHAHELFSYVEQQCSPLLDSQHLSYLANFSKLDEDAQCLLVRFLTRKPKFLATSSLQYSEIANLHDAIAVLLAQGYISPVRNSDWPDFVKVLTKTQLLQCLRSAQLAVKTSTSKIELLKAAETHLDWDIPAVQKIAGDFLVRRQQLVIDYILFLYFGDLRNRFQKFAMRDLGVLKTRKPSGATTARFASRQEATSAFILQTKQRDFRLNPTETRESLAQYLISTDASGTSAQQFKDRLLLDLGEEFLAHDESRAIMLWRQSQTPKAYERWIRETYKCGDRDALKAELIALRDQELPAATRVFVEDFFARKYLGKRTSVFTDMLREAARIIELDEAYLDQVEEGVVQHYRRQGVDACFTENKHWRVMFALTFWPLLFGKDQAQHNEFDTLPAALRNDGFYQRNRCEIERCLERLDDPVSTIQTFTKLATTHYGVPTGLFRWKPELLDSVKMCLLHAPAGAIAKVLIRMAKDYKNTRDGYPDLMIIDNGELRFEEVKSPGDSLRPNQLVSINRLRRAGLRVDISQTAWATDPNQTYAVVDIETTGGRRGGNSITEIAVVKVRNKQVVGEWSSLINPQRHIPAHITKLTGISNQLVAGAPLFEQIADELEAELDDAIFVAHNVGFDYGFIKAAYAGMNRSFRMPKFCTVVNSRRTFPGLKSYSLGKLTQHFDIDLDNHHRALSDARATADLLCLIQEARIDERSVQTG